MGLEREMTPMMKCGHAANATSEVDGTKVPVCAICAGILAGAWEVADNQPDLTGRMARCCYDGRVRPNPADRNDHSGPKGRGYSPPSDPVPSSPNLPFFQHRPDQEEDLYYCGCFGWD
jgi:hypothetical protein